MSDEQIDPIIIGNIIGGDEESRLERKDAAANRAKILETADALFAARGVELVNMADIAQAASVGKGTLYRRFANKGELCLALMDSQMTEFQDTMLARLQQMTANGIPKVEQLLQFIDSLVHFTDVHAPLLCEVQRAGLLHIQGSDSSRLQLPHFWQYMTVSGLLRSAVAAGEISAEIDVDYLADALLAPLKADLFHFQTTVRGFTLTRISAGLQTLVEGIRLIPPQE